MPYGESESLRGEEVVMQEKKGSCSGKVVERIEKFTRTD